jgi:uncharacterized protein (TIGR04168 family)
VRIAVIGDVHERWEATDCEILDGMGYDLVVFVGDLADRLHRRTLEVARRIAPLRTPALLIPGNHDATSPLGVLFEGLHRATRRPGQARRAERRYEALKQALGPVQLAGYSTHPFPEHGLTVIAGRPHAMDGRRLSFLPTLERRHNVRSLEGSVARYRSLVDSSEGALLFVAHNGPRGLGTDKGAPFAMRRSLDGAALSGALPRSPSGGLDLGDPDLADAVAWAKAQGRTVLAVVAGHMHHRSKTRRWQLEQDGVLYVNAARVPRVFEQDGVVLRHHVELSLQAAPGQALATERLIEI